MKTKIYLNLLAAGMLAFMASCAGDENIDRNKGKETDNSSALTSFSSVSPNRLMKYTPRTSMGGHDYLAGSRFYWEPGDNIYVKDDNNALQKSSMSNIAATQPRARFQVPGAYTAQNTYEVYYTGAAAGATSDKVVISTTQTQTAPNTAKHIGGVGDCGTSTATRVGDHFEFMLNHKAAYLCFLPRVTNAELGKNIYLTKIVVKSDNAIAGDYTLSMGGLSSAPTANAATEITLTTQGTTLPNGFPLSNTATDVATNAAYMVIAPGTHSLTVDYYIKDPATGVEGAITKTLPTGKLFEANKVYDITANLTPTDYSDRKYYTWDAKQNYWYQHEWNTTAPWQPTMNDGHNPYYPTSSDANRWYNSVFDGGASPSSQSCQTCPNVNETIWLCMQGNPHWDSKTMWSAMGHLYKGGMWLKKKDANCNPTNYNGIDYRSVTSWTDIYNYTIGDATTLSNKLAYFYIPALGLYNRSGSYRFLGVGGYYWTSNYSAMYDGIAYSLNFDRTSIRVCVSTRSFGFNLWILE